MMDNSQIENMINEIRFKLGKRNRVLIFVKLLEYQELKLNKLKRNERNLWTDSLSSNNSQRKSRRCIT
jgi:hypothetical protein